MSSDLPTVQENHVLILDFGDRRFFVKACRSGAESSVKLGANKCPKTYTSSLIGLPYGCVVELNGSKLSRTPDDVMSPPLSTLSSSASPTPSTTQTADNRDLVDSNTSQKINQNDIHAMKASGASGVDIVSELITSSKTFEGKTEFSKAKYIKRKVKKYIQRARVVKCTASTVCDLLFFKDAKRYMCLRPDSLAQILSYSNVYSGSTVLTFDTIGIPTAAIVERMQGMGRILCVHATQDPPHRQILERFNFDFKQQSVLKYVSAHELFPSSSDSPSESLPDLLGQERDSMIAQGWPVPLQPHTQEHLLQMKTDKEREEFLFKRASRFIRKLTRPNLEETKSYLETKVDSLVIATRHNPLLVLRTLLPYLAPSCPFVIFAEHIQSLAECFDVLKTERLAIKLQLSETWKREFQMLTGRTHPEMTMDATGGYILTGCKISDKEITVEKKVRMRENLCSSACLGHTALGTSLSTI